MNGRTWNEKLRARGLRPVAELAANRSHGDRLRYMAGCRCKDCRRANSAYESMRQRARRNGDWNGIVPAAAARAHLLKLSRLGVGRRAVGAASDVADSILFAIRTKKKTHIRARTARRILAVTPAMASDHAYISARRTWKLIGCLIEEGYTKTFLAQRLGYARAIQFTTTRVTVRNAARVEQLYQKLTT
jgi:hypothetical protein